MPGGVIHPHPFQGCDGDGTGLDAFARRKLEPPLHREDSIVLQVAKAVHESLEGVEVVLREAVRPRSHHPAGIGKGQHDDLVALPAPAQEATAGDIGHPHLGQRIQPPGEIPEGFAHHPAHERVPLGHRHRRSPLGYGHQHLQPSGRLHHQHLPARPEGVRQRRRQVVHELPTTGPGYRRRVVPVHEKGHLGRELTQVAQAQSRRGVESGGGYHIHARKGVPAAQEQARSFLPEGLLQALVGREAHFQKSRQTPGGRQGNPQKDEGQRATGRVKAAPPAGKAEGGQASEQAQGSTEEHGAPSADQGQRHQGDEASRRRAHQARGVDDARTPRMGGQEHPRYQAAPQEGHAHREVQGCEVKVLLRLPGNPIRVEGHVVEGHVSPYHREGKSQSHPGQGIGEGILPAAGEHVQERAAGPDAQQGQAHGHKREVIPLGQGEEPHQGGLEGHRPCRYEGDREELTQPFPPRTPALSGVSSRIRRG